MARTDRPRRAGTLRELEPQYRILFERNPHPMWVFDTETLRFLAVNDAAIEQYGYSRVEFMKMSILDIRPADDPPRPWRATARTGADFYGIGVHRRKSGEHFDVEVYWNVVEFEGRPAHLVLAMDVSHRKLAERKIRRLHERLERRVVERTAALEAANRELEAQVQERTRLSNEVVRVQETERRRLARELHDEVGQILTGLKMTLQAIRFDDGDGAREKLAWAQSMLDSLMLQIRELSLQLRPAVLDDLGLLPALLWHIDRYTTQTGVRVAFTHVGIDVRLPPDVETAAYRIVQEALTNVARHAGVTEAKLWVRGDDRELVVIVEDEGRGLPRDQAVRHSGGLSGMRERALLLGGQLLIEAAGQAGTRVTAILPIGTEPPT